MISIFFIILLFMFIIYYYYEKTHYFKIDLVESDIDSKSYLVRDLPDKKLAANMLAKININMQKLRTYLITNKEKYPKYSKYIAQLDNKLKDTKIQESSDDGLYTSYSVNKGEEIIFCLRSRNEKHNKLHDLNLLMYVVLHEMAHVACPEFGHTELFKDIFSFFVIEAINIGIYTKIDFKANNTPYCGLNITDSIV